MPHKIKIEVSSIEVTMDMTLSLHFQANILLESPNIDAILADYPQNNGKSTFNNQEISYYRNNS
jgi:hypothetical protein